MKARILSFVLGACIACVSCSKTTSEQPKQPVDPTSYEVLHGPVRSIQSQCADLTETVSLGMIAITPSSYREYDRNTCITSYLTYDADGAVTSHYEFESDENGHRTRFDVYNPDGTLYSSQRYTYEDELLVDLQTSDKEGHTYAWTIQDGYPSQCQIYNSEGQLLYIQNYKYEGKVLIYMGYEDMIKHEKQESNNEWNDLRQLTQSDRHFTTEGVPHTLLNTYTYDEQHLLVWAQTYVDEKLYDDATFTYDSFDEYGNWLSRTMETSYYSATGTPQSFLETRTITYYE